MVRLLLFDVDQTLLSTAGGDRLALNTAFKEMFGVEDGFEGIDFAGRMDLSIVGEAFAKWNVPNADEVMGRFKHAYVRNLESVLDAWTEGGDFPGVRTLLDRLSQREDVHLGLVTGNFRETAFVKLRKYCLDGYFSEGGFGGDSTERSEIVALGIKRCQAQSGAGYSKDDICVIGDSPRDVQAGRANGVKTVAVATGYYSEEQLGQHEPTLLFSDLSDTGAFLSRVLDEG